jgi:hypothetical protein
MGTVGANRVRYYERIPPLSALAILIPVGKTNAPAAARCPLCGAMGEPLMLPIHLQAVHGYGQPAIGTQPVQPGQTIIQQPYGEQPPVWPTFGPPPPAKPGALPPGQS